MKKQIDSLVVKTINPSLPKSWDYDKSVEKVKSFVYKWRNLTEEIYYELKIAREILSQKAENQPRNTAGTFVPTDKTWEQYCEDIGCNKRTVNRWLSMWQDKSLVGKMTANAENYTPQHIIDRVRLGMGSIDLDPASCKSAQRIVEAGTYYTEKTNGLNKKWSGNVFLNPPYGMPLIKEFTDKLIAELPNIKQAILLTNDQTDTNWWQKCAKESSCICFVNKRIKFYTPDIAETSPTNGQTFMYFGNDRSDFIENFKDLGLIMEIV